MSKASMYMSRVQDIRYDVEMDIVKMLMNNDLLSEHKIEVRGKVFSVKLAKDNGRTVIALSIDGALSRTNKLSIEFMMDILDKLENGEFVD